MKEIIDLKQYGLTDEEIAEAIEINEFENNNPEYDALKLI